MNYVSRDTELHQVAEDPNPVWAFLANHARVLLCVARDAGLRLRDIGERVGITERAAHRIVTELVAAGYVTRERNGRRNHYTINTHLPLLDPIARTRSIGELLEILAGPPPAKRRGGHPAKTR
jgi:hypothetical protein